MSPHVSTALVFVRRYPLAVACGVVALLSGGAAWYLSGSNSDLEIVRQDRAKEGEAMFALLVGGTAQREELAAVREAARRIEDNLVIESNLAENAFYFYKFEEQTKARLPELHPLSSPVTDPNGLYRRVPYSMRVSGSYEQVFAFMFAIESGPRLVNITSFGLGRRVDGISLELSLELLGKK
jgi:hypothetical protein